MKKRNNKPLVLALWVAAGVTMAAEQEPTLASCAAIGDDRVRLACFDRVAGARSQQTESQEKASPVIAAAAAPSPARTPTPVRALPQPSTEDVDRYSLSRHWELDDEYKQGLFNFRPHRANYLLLAYNRDPNSAPYQPFTRLTQREGDLARTEAVFQLSFKLKALQNIAGSKSDLWFGYTQNSFWQAGNQEASSPFRESNYQPEFMLVTPTDLSLFGVRLRFVNLGLVHQSNGQVSTLSRSWNRAYLQAGLERGNFSLVTRVWKRFNENAGEDDNPDIVDYMGRGDIYAAYRINGHELSMLARHNFSTDRGALQLGWAFPLVRGLKGYVQAFSGYGQSLIDYNYSQTSLGLGVMVSY